VQLEEEILKKLNKIYGKYLATQGLPVWGAIAKTAQGDYRVLYVDDDGKLVVSASISGTVDVSDRWARQLGQIDIARYLGSAVGLTNPLHSQIVYGGAVIDPRSIRALLSSDVVTAYGSQTQAMLQRATTYDLLVQLRNAGVEIDPRSIRALAKATDEVYSVLRTDAGVAYDSRDRSWNLGASDVPDLSDRAARLLGRVYGSQGQQLLQRALTYESVVQLSHQGSEYDARQIRALTSSDVVDVSDKATRLLGVIYGSQAQQLLQRATTYDLIVQLRSAGVEIDPRSIRALVKTTDELYSVLRTDAGVAYDARQIRSLISTDVITAYGSQAQALLQRATTYDLLVQLRNAGAEIDPRDVSDRANRLLGVVYGSQAQALLQRATTYDLIVQLRSAGSEIDPRAVLGSQSQQLQQRASSYDLLVAIRQAGSELSATNPIFSSITDITKVVTATYLAPTALGAGGTATIVNAPGVGYKLRLKGIQISVDATTRIDLRWGTTAWRSYYLSANGSIERNFVSENVEGGDNVALTLLSSAAANVTASATTETLAV